MALFSFALLTVSRLIMDDGWLRDVVVIIGVFQQAVDDVKKSDCLTFV